MLSFLPNGRYFRFSLENHFDTPALRICMNFNFFKIIFSNRVGYKNKTFCFFFCVLYHCRIFLFSAFLRRSGRLSKSFAKNKG